VTVVGDFHAPRITPRDIRAKTEVISSPDRLNPDFAMEARQQVWTVHPDGESSDG
jgi:hypothetical protein